MKTRANIRLPPRLPGYSDYQLHTFCCHNYLHLGGYRLPPDCLLSSGKLTVLDKLLRELRERGSRCACTEWHHARICRVLLLSQSACVPASPCARAENPHAHAVHARRVLLFSQWTSVLDIMEWFLHERGMLYHRLDGSTNVRGPGTGGGWTGGGGGGR